MTLIHVFAFLVLAFGISGCGPAYNRSVVKERPSQNIKQMLILIEAPRFSAQNLGKGADSALMRYQIRMQGAIRSDFVRVMKDNGISAKLMHSTMVPIDAPLATIDKKDLSDFPYVLLVRHVKGLAQCNRIDGHCEAYFQTELKLFEAASSRMIWSAQESGGTHYGYVVWEDGRMYRDILAQLHVDGMISLPNDEPTINVPKYGNLR